MRLRNIPGAFEAILEHPMAIQWDELEAEEKAGYRGHWHELFGNSNPIHIEIGMGKGQFLMNLARRNPEINYVGIERYSSVLLRAIEKFDTEEFNDLTNVRFVCMDANELPDMFEKDEVDQIYLNFSDPWPKARHAKRRLTSKEFLSVYEKVLKDGCKVEFKTDNTGLFDFSLEQLQEVADRWTLTQYTYDLHHNEEMNQGNIMTEYEQKFSEKGNPIHKLIAYLK